MKKFLISIDTEGDNLWNWRHGESITTENAKFLPRFQSLCDKFGFKPTYLTNYEMAQDEFFVSFASQVLKDNACEIGMHLHAWNSPPLYDLPFRTDVDKEKHPYLIEYPKEVMGSKIKYMTEILTDTFGCAPVTHRAGRWATNDIYFDLLDKYGYKFDCSVTPGISWEKNLGQSPDSVGSDYTSFPKEPFLIKNTNITEIPVTVRKNHRIIKPEKFTFKSFFSKYYKAIKRNETIWLRPNGKNLDDMLYLVDKVSRSKSEYLMFMLHSSEFMPGGSWIFKTSEDIDKLFSHLELLFKEISKNFIGATIGDFGTSIKSLTTS